MVSVDDRRGEIERHAELLELDRDRRDPTHPGRRRAGNRHRKLAAGEKTGSLAVRRGQVRLGQRGQQPLLRQGIEDGLKSPVAAADCELKQILIGDLAA